MGVLAIGLGLCLAGSAEAAPAVVKAEIDLADAAGLAAQIERLAAAIPDDPVVVRLDLAIHPAERGARPDYRVFRTTARGAQAPVRCGGDTLRFSGATRSFGFAFNPDYNHLLLSVFHAPRDVAPFLTAACEYRAGRPHPAFVIRGFFAVSAVGIPTARDVELRPVAPPR